MIRAGFKKDHSVVLRAKRQEGILVNFLIAE